MFGKQKDQDHSLSSPQTQRFCHRLMYKQHSGGDAKEQVKSWGQGNRAGEKLTEGEVVESLLWAIGAQFYRDLLRRL